MDLFHDETLILRDGRRLSYRTMGDHTQPLVIYLGGLIASRIEMEMFFDDRCFFVGIDRPGYGRSDFNPHHTPQSLADDVAELIQHLGYSKARIFGVSGGGAFGIIIASMRPDRIERVSAFAPISPYRTADISGTYVGRFPFFVAHPWIAWLHALALYVWFSLPAFVARCALFFDHNRVVNCRAAHVEHVRIYARSFREALRQGTRGLHYDLEQYVNNPAWGPVCVTNATAPIMIFHGTADFVTPLGCSEWFAAHVPHCELRTFEGETHMSVPLMHMRDMWDWLHER